MQFFGFEAALLDDAVAVDNGIDALSLDAGVAGAVEVVVAVATLAAAAIVPAFPVATFWRADVLVRRDAVKIIGDLRICSDLNKLGLRELKVQGGVNQFCHRVVVGKLCTVEPGKLGSETVNCGRLVGVGNNVFPKLAGRTITVDTAGRREARQHNEEHPQSTIQSHVGLPPDFVRSLAATSAP